MTVFPIDGGRFLNRRAGLLILFTVLAVLWGTVVAAPFRVFADMARDAAASAAGRAGLSGPLSACLAYLASAVLMTALLLAGRTRHAELIAGACALAGTVWHMAGRLADRTFTSVSAGVLVGLAAALLLLLFKVRTANRILGDAFAASLAVMVLHDAAVAPLLTRFRPDGGGLPGRLGFGGESLLGTSDLPGGVPVWIAGILIASAVAGVMTLAAGTRAATRR